MAGNASTTADAKPPITATAAVIAGLAAANWPKPISRGDSALVSCKTAGITDSPIVICSAWKLFCASLNAFAVVADLVSYSFNIEPAY